MTPDGDYWGGSSVIFAGIGVVVFIGVAVVAAIPTLVIMWVSDGAKGTRLACGAGMAAGMAISAYFHYDLHSAGHDAAAAVALVAALFSPLMLAHRLHDPEFPNESFTPPWRREQARASDAGRTSRSERADTSERKRDTGPDQASGPDGARSSDRKRDTGPGQAGASGRRQYQWPRRAAAQIIPEEAWQVLGLEPGASQDEIHATHRRLMMKLHPDVGGSNYLASKVNTARDVLVDG